MSFLRWAGSKRQLIPILSSLWYASRGSERRSKYIEGFCGSAALFFSVQPRRSVLIDCNTALIDCIRRIQVAPQNVAQALSKLVVNEKNYYEIRALDLLSMDPDFSAARFIYLNRLCFNGLYRTNAAGKFNVPYGGWKAGRLPDKDQILRASTALRHTKIVNGDFEIAVQNSVGENDFVYLDPPYAVRNKSLDFQYGPDVFGTEDIKRLSNLADAIDAVGATFVISYVDCPEIACLIDRWGCERVQVRRTVAAKVSKRTSVSEVLITNL